MSKLSKMSKMSKKSKHVKIVKITILFAKCFNLDLWGFWYLRCHIYINYIICINYIIYLIYFYSYHLHYLHNIHMHNCTYDDIRLLTPPGATFTARGPHVKSDLNTSRSCEVSFYSNFPSNSNLYSSRSCEVSFQFRFEQFTLLWGILPVQMAFATSRMLLL